MKSELHKHLLAYSILVFGLSVFAVAFLYFWPLRSILRILVFVLVGYYVTWGALAHLKSDRVTRRVVIEYLGFGLIAGSLLLMLTI